MMESPEFTKAYNNLNTEQKMAVDAIDGPVMVIAGPGTGKTSILTLRIANILRKTDTEPSSILALTFTESGAHSMRKKLVDIIGSAAYRVNIFTFHGFCNTAIESYPEYFPRIVGGTLVTEIDQIRILEAIFQTNSFEILKPYGNIFYYLRPALGAIRTLKRENISPKDFAKLIKQDEKEFKNLPDLYHVKGAHKGKMKGEYIDVEKKIEKNKELLVVYEAYEKALLEGHFFDYEDMIVLTIDALEKNPNFLLILQEEYQYVLADEHQDANNAQNKILELLSGFHEHPNLFIVGDEKQAIYRFQGASLENFLYFKKKYKDALVIPLEKNYRSTQTILDAAHGLINANSFGQEVPRIALKAVNASTEKNIEIYEFNSEISEADFIAHSVKKLLDEGVEPFHIAVLFRDNRDSEGIAYAFQRQGIAYTVASDEDLLQDAELHKLILLLRAVVAFGDEVLISRVLFLDFLGLDHLDVFKLIKASRDTHTPLYDLMRDDPRFSLFYSKLKSWSVIAHNKSLVESFEYIVKDSGFLAHILSSNGSLEKLAKLDSLFASVKEVVESHRSYTLRDFLEYLDTLELHKARINRSTRPSFEHSVLLMTAHRSKGLEFEYVFVYGAAYGKWGNKRVGELFSLPIPGRKLLESDTDEDERRLFYVALTRAKKLVTITFATSTKEGKPRLKSRFVEEIPEAFVETKTAPMLSPRSITEDRIGYNGVSLQDKEYLQKLFLEYGLNVTAINNFLSCPWRYFFENLVRIPRVQEKHQMFGTAVHRALKDLYTHMKRGEKPTEKYLIESFVRALKNEPLETKDYEDTLQKGTLALKGYFKKWSETFLPELLTELSVAGVYVDFDDEHSIMLRGQLDKVEPLGGSRVRVVDYKTGKPKSRNAILGETKDSEGNMKRQLDFYKLLLSLWENGRYDMTEGMIDFVEPTEKGDYKREIFEMKDADKDDVLSLTKDVARQIYNVEFWDKTCDDPDCEYCELRKNIV